MAAKNENRNILLMNKDSVGVYDFGNHRCVLRVRFGTGAEFTTVGPSGLEEIQVGLDYKRWSHVVGALLHEMMELAYADMNVRFRLDTDFAGANDGYHFVFDHNIFSEATARVAPFLVGCLPDLAKAYRKHHQQKVKGKS